jgi:hypothetical protein
VIVGQQEDFLVHDGFLFKGNRLRIFEESLRLKIIQEMHNEGHMGHAKMHNEGNIYGLWNAISKEGAWCEWYISSVWWKPESQVCDLGVEKVSFVDFFGTDNILSNSFNNGFDDFYTIEEKLLFFLYGNK